MTTGTPQIVERQLRICFVGCVEEGRRTFEHLVASGVPIDAVFTLVPERAAALSGAVPWDDVTDQAGVTLHYVTTMNDPTAIALLRSLAPDLVICVGWTQLLGAEVLAVPRLGCVGFHASLLPHYRGRAPVNWTIINGESVTGNTMMLLDEGVDTGDILAQRVIPIGIDDTCATIYDAVARSEADMLDEVLALLRVGLLPRRPQPSGQWPVMAKRRPDDGEIDWTWTARRVHDWIRALTHPYPGAFTTIAGARVWLWKARPLADGATPALAPGQWSLLGDGSLLVVGCGRGSVVIERVQQDGDIERDGRDFWARRLATDHALVGPGR